MNSIFSRLVDMWRGLNNIQRTSIAGAGVLGVVAVVLLLSWASRPNMQAAFSGLSPEDAQAMTEKLQEQGIPFELASGGTTIMVPQEQMAEARVGLASEGLPKGGSNGFELFDKQNFGATDFSQRVNYQRALEGELGRTISQLEEVDNARVHIALGKESVFVDKEKPATASVVVKLRPGEELTPRQVKGIVRLVAGSVEGLDPKNVTMTDMTGNILTGEDGGAIADDGTAGSNAQQAAKARYERDMEQRLNTMLATALGANKVITKVAVDMDFDQTEEKSTTYTPVVGGQGIVELESTTDENFKGSRPGSGVAGTPTNIPGVATLNSAGSTSSYEKGIISRKFKINETNTVKKKATGTVKRQTIAVLVDGKLTPVETDRVRGIVEAGAGVDVGRGDIVRVESLPFNDSAASKEAEEMASQARRDMYLDIVKYALLAIGTLVFFLFLMSRMRRPRDVIDGSEPFFQAPEALDSYIPGELQPQPQLQIAEAKPSQIEQRTVESMVEERADDAARLVRAWLSTRD